MVFLTQKIMSRVPLISIFRLIWHHLYSMWINQQNSLPYITMLQYAALKLKPIQINLIYCTNMSV